MPMPSRDSEQPRVKTWAPVTLLVGCVCWLLCASAASAANFTWSGGGGAGAKTWSTAANWVGDTAPTSGASIGTLTFPDLTAGVQSENDLSGLSIEQLQLDNTHGVGIGG